MDADAVFHEESEYVIGFQIRATNDELLSIFRKKCFLFFSKKCKSPKKYLTGMFIKIGLSSENFITKMISAKKLYKP